MYLSVNDCFELDKIVKSFEVAYRSYITNELISKHPDLSSFSVAVNQIDSSIDKSPIILSHKYKARIEKIKREVGSHYKKITDCHQSYVNKDFENQVPYVSDIIDYVVFFFNDCLFSLSRGFSSIEEFNSLNIKYNQVRNWLSHPASSKITVESARQTLGFIKKVTSQFGHESYFWYVPSRQLHTWINDLLSEIEATTLSYHNLSEVTFSHHGLIERDKELQLLHDLIFGKKEGYRKSGSVAIFGYGGVGKTALALEFLYRIVKELQDEETAPDLEFLLFFSAKEELLSYSETTKKLYVKDIRKQITSFKDFRTKLNTLLKVKGSTEITEQKGLIVIDNFETLTLEDKHEFYEFIKSVPRTIQFILTSRNEEPCEDKINLTVYNADEQGHNFILQYIELYNLKLKIEKNERTRLLNLSKGNTLIIVLSLQLMSSDYALGDILSDLESVEAGNIEVISDFMYKNTIEYSIDQLKSNGKDPSEILKVISLYDVPVDLYSISKLSGMPINSTEEVCEYLASKLVLEKKGESYKPNEFANKYIVSKFIPNRIELKQLKERIKSHQKELHNRLKKLDTTRKREPLLNGIMNDWKPRNSIDKIAIADAFNMFSLTKKVIKDNDLDKLNDIENEFSRIEKMTSHPYIRYQKARCYQLFLESKKITQNQKEIKETVSKYFEEAIDTTDFYYPYIKNTKSYASINWIYGIFLSSVIYDLKKSLRYLEDAVILFQKLRIKDKSYFTAVNNLSWVYSRLYLEEKDEIYLEELKPLVEEVKKNKKKLLEMRFKYDLYMKNFAKYFQNKI